MTNINTLNRMDYAQKTFHIGSTSGKDNTEKTAKSQDKVEVGGESTLRKTGKYALGATTAALLTPFYAVGNSVRGSIDAGLKGAGLEGRQEGIPEAVGQTIIVASTLYGAVIGASIGGIPGAFVGAIVAPGVTGGLISSTSGLVKGARDGITVARETANNVNRKVYDSLKKTDTDETSGVTQKFAGFAGKTLGTAAGVATAIVSVPFLSLERSLANGIGFAHKAIGWNPKSGDTTKETLINFGKEATVWGSYILGAVKAPGLPTMIPAAVATAGGVATGVSGLMEGAKGITQACKDGMEFAEMVVN